MIDIKVDLACHENESINPDMLPHSGLTLWVIFGPFVASDVCANSSKDAMRAITSEMIPRLRIAMLT